MTYESNNTSVPEFGKVVAPVVVAQAPMVHTSRPVSVSPRKKPEKFNGLNFKRWQKKKKMLFHLTTLNLARFLIEDGPKLKEDERDIQVINAIDSWKHSNFLCKNYVLNGLIDSLYNVYCTKSSKNELWESLDQKYKTEDIGAKKFIMGRFLIFKMVDSKTMTNQV